MHPPASARTVTVGFERLPRWLAGFTERHGATRTARDAAGATVILTGADDARAWVEVPFAPLAAEPGPADGEWDAATDLLAHVARPWRVAVVLARRGGHAAGLFEGATLVASKVGSSYVQGTTKAGGWSQQRYARRRANQADAAYAAAADAAVAVLGGADPDVVIAGGDRVAVAAVLADRRLAHLPAPSPPWLAVPDPRLRVLVATPEQFRIVRIRLDP